MDDDEKVEVARCEQPLETARDAINLIPFFKVFEEKGDVKQVGITGRAWHDLLIS